MKVLILLFILSLPALAEEAIKPLGRWKIFHSDGRPIFVTVLPDGKATCTGAEATEGNWKLNQGRLDLVWSDGWRDLIVVEGKGYRKWGYAPKASLDSPPGNKTAAYKISEKP